VPQVKTVLNEPAQLIIICEEKIAKRIMRLFFGQVFMCTGKKGDEPRMQVMEKNQAGILMRKDWGISNSGEFDLLITNVCLH
jgi:hypothetical protein